jgi:hypothetical protein
MIDRSIDFGTVWFEFGTYSTVQVIVFLTKTSTMTSYGILYLYIFIIAYTFTKFKDWCKGFNIIII